MIDQSIQEATLHEDDPNVYAAGSIRDDVTYLRPDGELERLVMAANRGVLSIPVTLTIGGSLVSGDMIGLADYFDHTAAEIGGWQVGDGKVESGEVQPRGLAKAYVEAAAEVRAENEADVDDPFGPRHIHLRGVRMITGNNHINASLWRGRLTAVNGWAFGTPNL